MVDLLICCAQIGKFFKKILKFKSISRNFSGVCHLRHHWTHTTLIKHCRKIHTKQTICQIALVILSIQ